MEFIGRGTTPSTCRCQGWGDRTASGGQFVPVPDCSGEEGVASVVCAAAEVLVLEAAVASSSTCRLQFEVRAPHARLTSGDLGQHG